MFLHTLDKKVSLTPRGDSFSCSEKRDHLLRKIRSADSFPGILDTLLGMRCYLYGAHEESTLKGNPGEIIAQRDGAICRATGDGAIWIMNDTFEENTISFCRRIDAIAKELACSNSYEQILNEKRQTRRNDEEKKPLQAYRDEELQHMWINFFGTDQSYHLARKNFVYKGIIPCQHKHTDSGVYKDVGPAYQWNRKVL